MSNSISDQTSMLHDIIASQKATIKNLREAIGLSMEVIQDLSNYCGREHNEQLKSILKSLETLTKPKEHIDD